MVALGVLNHSPVNPAVNPFQAPLERGIHLRWGFLRELGFPWHGFFLFRRPSRRGRELCLGAVTGGLKKGVWPDTKYYSVLGLVSSNANLVLTQDFSTVISNQIEFALDGRDYLRFDLPSGELARRVELSIGFRSQGCLDFQKLIPPPVAPAKEVTRPNPLNLQGASITVKNFDGQQQPINTQFETVNTTEGPLIGLKCSPAMTIKLSDASDKVELLLSLNPTLLLAGVRVEGFDSEDKLVATAQMLEPQNQPKTITLNGKNIIRLEVRTNGLHLYRICSDKLRDVPAKLVSNAEVVDQTKLVSNGEVVGQAEVVSNTEVKVTAFSGATPIRSFTINGQAGKVQSVTIEADAISSVEIGPCRGSLVNLCYVPVAQDATEGWEKLTAVRTIEETFPAPTYPIGLPVSQPDYPCSVPNPQSLVTERVHYQLPAAWNGDGSTFTELHDQLVKLVEGGPFSVPMVDRLFTSPEDSSPPQISPPKLSKFHILDMVILGALHPALAQLVGLYWVDQTAETNKAYDYLIVADHTGVGQHDGDQVLAVIETKGFAELDGYIVFNQRRLNAAPLPAPSGLQTFELPGGYFPDAQGNLPKAANNAGLRWEVGEDDAGGLLPESAVMYLVWRDDLNNEATPAPAGIHDLITMDPADRPKPLLVTEARQPNGLEPQRSPEWLAIPHFIDRNLPDGWYSYQVSGMDLFGRHSPNSLPAQLLLRDRIPPPMPTAVEAYALDPEDRFLQKDAAYEGWVSSLSPASLQQTLVGLRVRWTWTTEHQRQAPDTTEFRIYFQPGANLPTPHDQGIEWQERYHVVGYNDIDIVKIDSVSGDRLYEIFLPPPAAANLTSIPLNPSLADPVVYAHIGVSAADNKPHTVDQRTSGNFSNRPGNEGRVGPPARIYRVWRTPPPPPEEVLPGERLYASPADYYSRSFFTYRWKPRTNLDLHVFRAMDEGVFKADWAKRPSTPPLSESELALFPAGWNQATRQQVADELNHLNTFVTVTDRTLEAMAYYHQLSDGALRVLAGLPSGESAFVQLTINALKDTENLNRRGPDNPDDLVLDLNQRAFIDSLDGGSTNRYFYRAAFVDGALNLGPLGLSSPPVYLPNVVPPRAPVITKVLGGDRQITIKWASNREPDLAEYRVYRTDNEEAARDLRLMTLVHTEVVAPGNPATRPAEVSWTDALVHGLTIFYCRLVAVDAAGNVSVPCSTVMGRAFDDSRPAPPTWEPPSTGATDEMVLSWSAAVADLRCLVQRRVAGTTLWENVSNWLPRRIYTWTDDGRIARLQYEYRLRVMDSTGKTNNLHHELTA